LRILHVAPSIARAYGGPTHSLAAYVRAAQLHVCECTIVAPDASADDVASLEQSAPDAAVRLFPSQGAGAFVWSPALVRFVRLHASDYDVVHVHGLLNPVSSLAARACRRAGAPVVIRPFGTMSRYTFQHRRRALKRAYHAAIDAPNLRAAAAVHFTTATERDEASWLGIAVDERAYVIPPPAFELSTPPARAVPAEPRAFTALIVSRLDPVKNIELLLDAWTVVRAKLDSARLVIAGEGPDRYRRSLVERAGRLGVGAAVDFVGYAGPAGKQALYADADVFVLPSKHENFGIAALEALAAGLPVVVSRHVQLADVIEAHGLGVVVPATRQALADALLSLSSNAEWRRACGARAPRVVAEAFSPVVVGGALRAMYESVSTDLHEHLATAFA